MLGQKKSYTVTGIGNENHGKDEHLLLSQVNPITTTLSQGEENIPTKSPREHWPHHMEFVLSCVGYAVGYGSIWRFPYLCMRNGGGAFLIPYVTCMLVCGVPLFFMELAIGQFAGASPLALWDICPLFKGLGWCMLIVSGIVCIYYNIILAWVIYYLAQSFAFDVPWRTCANDWNTCLCRAKILDYNSTSDYLSWVRPENCSLSGNSSTPAEEFWKFKTLGISEGLHELGEIRWSLLLCLFIAWLLIFFCLFKGVKSIGKVVYFTATSPYVFLTILLIRNCMLEGSWTGIKYYLSPNFSKLLEVSIWAEAALQMFFSLGPAWGGLITMSSFNKFNSNCYRDSIIVPAINCLTSIFGGFVIFSVIGHMAHVSQTNIEDTLEVGPGIVFVAYPEAIANLPFAPFWAVCFFFMLITIGLDSQFGMFETMTSCFIDEFPNQLSKYKIHFTGAMCLLEFLLGVPLITQGGVYLFTIMDWYCGTFSVCLIALLECVVIFYIYGISKFREDIEMMIGHKPSHYWTVMWTVITPLTLLSIFIASVARYKTPTYGTYEYPLWIIVFGWCLGACSIVPIPLVMIYRLIMEPGDFSTRLRTLTKPRPNWGPSVAYLNYMSNEEHHHHHSTEKEV